MALFMAKYFLFVCSVLAQGNASSHPSVPKVARPISASHEVIVVHTEDWGLGSRGDSKIIVCFWSDGLIVWSRNRVRGGKPYYTGRIAPARFTELISGFERDNILSNKKLARSHLGPDSQFTKIEIRSGKRSLTMLSWHELYEDGGRVFASKSGLVRLTAASVKEALKREPLDYQQYRATWDRIRATIDAIIPKPGAKTAGHPQMRHGVLSWVEDSATPRASANGKNNPNE